MKKTKKLLAAVLSMTMACALALPAYAANITIEDSSVVSTYADVTRSYNGYRLLNLTTSKNEDETTNYAYTVNDKYRTVLQNQVFSDASNDFWTAHGTKGKKPDAATGVTYAQILKYLESLTSDNGDTPGTLRSFADKLYATITIQKIATDATSSNGSFTNLAQGYWMIADVTELGGTGEANSLVIVDTKGNEDLTITPKTSVPTVEKKVKEENDSTGTTSDWQDGADYDIGDNVPFQLTGTMPTNIANYETYKYIFHDDLSDGLTLNENSITVKIGNTTGNTTTLTKVTDYTVKTSEFAEGDTCDFEIVINDIKSIDGVTIGKNTKVVVEYTAKLDSDAVIGNSGNPNEVYLEFSNNPYGDGTGKTPEDKVTVFTFKLDVDKVDKDHNALKGAGFTLYKYDSDEKDYVAVGNEVKGENMTNFPWTGLDSGNYRLVETTVPAGYNKADDIEFTVEATYTTDGAEQSVTNLVVKDKNGTTISGDGEGFTFTATAANGTVATDVVNTTGIELPSTGGMGTTVFYILGGILVVGAAVLLVTKRRMDAEEK